MPGTLTVHLGAPHGGTARIYFDHLARVLAARAEANARS